MHQVKLWVNKHLHLTPKNVEFLVGILLIVKGIWLYHDTHYFFYPPSLKTLMNNDWIDLLIILIGLILITCVLFKPTNETSFKVRRLLIRLCLIVGAIIMLVLGVSQIFHGIFTPLYRMSHTALGDLFVFFVIDLTASDA